MKCPKCGSENVNVQVVSETKLVTKHRGIIYWIFVGWWWLPIKWLFLTIPALILNYFVLLAIKQRPNIFLNAFVKIAVIPGMYNL